MQLTSIVAVLTAVATVAVAQTAAPPQCAFSCLQSTDTHGCQASDISCLCHNAEFVAAQAQCITAACPNPSDLQQAEAFAQANCLNVGVTLSVPPASTTGTASTGSASPTSPSSSGTPAPSSTPTGAASALSAPVAVLAGIAACALAL